MRDVYATFLQWGNIPLFQSGMYPDSDLGWVGLDTVTYNIWLRGKIRLFMAVLVMVSSEGSGKGEAKWFLASW